MTIEELKQYVHSNPTKSFTLHIADGREIKVPHSDHIAFPQGKGRVLFVYGEGENPFQYVDVLMITGFSTSGQPAETE